MNFSSLPAKLQLKSKLVTFGFYHAFFMGLFAQFPLKNAVSGNTDTLIYIAYANTWIAKVAAFLGAVPAGRAMYPVESVFTYTEFPFGVVFSLVFFRLLGFGDVTAYYLLTTFFFSLTALATFVFAGLFLKSYPARLFAGFAFTCSNMMFAHMDDVWHLLYVFPLLSLTVLAYAFHEKNHRWTYLAAALGGLQIHFSIYVFIYQSVLVALFVLYQQFWVKQKLPWAVLAKGTFIYCAIAAPLVAYYAWMALSLNIVSPFNPKGLLIVMSWSFEQIFQALPGNLVHGNSSAMPLTWDLLRHQNLIGFSVIGAAAFAFFRRGEHRLIFGVMLVAGFVMALGPTVYLGASTNTPMSQKVFLETLLNSAIGPSPLFPFYEWIPVFKYHRVPIRAYFLVLLAVSLLAAITLQYLLERFPARHTVALLLLTFFGVHILENVPFPMRAYQVGHLLESPAGYEAFTSRDQDRQSLVLDLPSDIGFEYEKFYNDLYDDPVAFQTQDPELMPRLNVKDSRSTMLSYLDVYHYNRDAFYQNWQTRHKMDIIGGVTGYFPAARLIFDRRIKDLPDEAALRWFHKNGVDYIAYHPEMLLPGEENILPKLENSPLLRRIVSNDRMVAFSFVEPVAHENP